MAGLVDAGANRLPGDGSALARLATLTPSLRESERKIAEYVLAHPEELVYLSVTELADRTDTSEASVIRCAQRLGYQGFSALKIALALESRRDASQSSVDLAVDSDVATIKRAMIQLNRDSLTDTLELLDDAALTRAVNAIVVARRIEVYAVGGTASVAHDAAFMLMQIGFSTVALADPHLQAQSAVQLQPGDVVIGISLSGSTRDTVEAIQLARDAGATCISITRHARSPITRVAHVTLLAPARSINVDGHGLAARSSPIAVVDVLAAAVMLARREESLAALERGRQAINTRKRF